MSVPATDGDRAGAVAATAGAAGDIAVVDACAGGSVLAAAVAAAAAVSGPRPALPTLRVEKVEERGIVGGGVAKTGDVGVEAAGERPLPLLLPVSMLLLLLPPPTSEGWEGSRYLMEAKDGMKQERGEV